MIICKDCKSDNIVESAYVYSNSYKKGDRYSIFYEWSDKPEALDVTYYCRDCREFDCVVDTEWDDYNEIMEEYDER